MDDATINKFIELIGDQGPRPHFMRFFIAICSCNGKQIITNQELCLVRLFLDEARRKALMLEICTIPDVIAPSARQKWKARRPVRSRRARAPPPRGDGFGSKDARPPISRGASRACCVFWFGSNDATTERAASPRSSADSPHSLLRGGRVRTC